VKERPILFNGDMVRAILDGRKTQTRRPTKFGWCGTAEYLLRQSIIDPAYKSPFGTIGDRLWVRETWAPHCEVQGAAIYRCDRGGDYQDTVTENFRWTPSIHMPRWASRITLEITGVRVERVQEITEEDVWKEGWEAVASIPDSKGGLCKFANWGEYWNSIYGNWDADPWVWVYEFRRIKP